MEVTAPAQHAAWRDRVLPEVDRVRDGIWSIPVPVPDSPIRFTLCYVLEDGDGAVVVDPGWDSDDGWAHLLAGLAAIGRSPEQVIGIVATHVHPDHHGLSHRLLERAPDAWVGLSAAEAATLRRQRRSGAERRADEVSWRRAAGVAAEDPEVADLGAGRSALFSAMPDPTLLLEDGARLPLGDREVRVLLTPGHTPGHVCLVDEGAGVVLTGDHVLPRISPNVGLSPVSTASPLRDYLASLRAVARFDLEALPGHQWRFRGVPERAAELEAHHHERLDEIRALLAAGPATAAALAAALSWAHPWETLDPFQHRSAIAETIAHLIHLEEDGAVRADRLGTAALWSVTASTKEPT